MYERVNFAATPDKRPLLDAAVDVLARRGHPGEQALGADFGDDPDPQFEFFYYSDADVIQWVASRDFRCFLPGSAFSITELERLLEERGHGEAQQSGITLLPFATSPVVLVMPPAVHASLEKSRGQVGWSSLLLPDNQLGLMHAHARSGDGLAVVTAASLAAATGLDRLESAAVDGWHEDLMRTMQSSVLEYGPDDGAVVEHGLSEGRWRADVLAVQERAACAAATRFQELPFVVVHPYDTTIWVEQVACRTASATAGELQSLDRLAGGLRDRRMSQVYRAEGLRPLDEVVDASPLAALGNVRVVGAPSPPTPPPPRRLLRTIRKRWTEQKKAADVCLVLDTSGSMRGPKLTAAKHGATLFLRQLEGRDTNVSLITFSSTVETWVGLQAVETGRSAVDAELSQIRAGGGTALFDGVSRALDVLDGADEGDKLRAVVVLTDGQENGSVTTLPEIQQRLRSRGRGVLVFAISYGTDAARRTLDLLVASAAGHSQVSDERDIQSAFDSLSAHL